jgi:meso-butanediol dehydrogenase/(S,S)-butanediol dehydrogenase/diacetyl reductase
MKDSVLQEKVGIITGAGRGIGRSIALALARKGVRLALAARTEVQIRSVQAEIENLKGEAVCFPTDVGNEAQALALVRDTVGRFGRLDILVNNAGMGGRGPWEQTPTEKWDSVMAVNARGPYVLCREAIPHLRRQGGGHIINILSIGGVRGYEGYGVYSVSKNALRALTITLSKELRRENIRVHAISMGAVNTPLMRQGLGRRPDIDPNRLIQPEEIAELVLLLVTWKGNGIIDEIQIRRPDASYWA